MKAQKLKQLIKHGVLAQFILLLSLNASAQSNYYWVGGSGNWTDYANHWATSTGGTTFHTNAPSSDDNVYFDSNSFTSSGQVVTLDDYPEVHDMDWRGVQFSPLFQSANPDDEGVTLTGSIFLQSGMIFDVSYLQLDGFGDDSEVIDTDGVCLSNTEFTILQVYTDYSLLDSLAVLSFRIDQSGDFDFTNFSSNGHPINSRKNLELGTNYLITGLMDFSNSTLYTESFRLNDEHPSGELRMNGTEIRVIHEGGITEINKLDYPTSIVTNYRIEANHTIRNKAPIFDHLTIDPGVELSIDPNIAGIEFNTILADGNGANRVTIKSMDSGEAASLIHAGGIVEFHNVDFQDIKATGGATFNAYGSRNLGNVTGINFIKADQVITFDALEQKDYEDIGQTYELNASSTSDLELNYLSSDPNVASVEGNQLTIEGMGTVEITAKQEGDEAYNAATPVARSFDVTKANQQISFDQLEDIELSQQSITLDATSSSGLPITYEIHGPASLNSAVLNLLDVGTVQLTAKQAGNENYNSAESVTHTFEVYRILGLEETIMIKAFPNPAQNMLHVEANEIVKMNLYDLNGNQIFNVVSKNASFDLSTYPKGIYILSIEGNGQAIQRTILAH